MECFELGMINSLLQHEELFKEYNLDLDFEKISIIKEKLENKDFVVSVLGSMKAGKSTFINALLGEELMPSENAACTLTTTEIINNKNGLSLIKEFKSGKSEEIKGSNLSKIFLDEIRKSRESQSEESFKYILNYDIKSIDIDNLNMGFKIVDTPGINEMSGLGVDRKEIEKIFDRQLKRTDYIVYVLDYKYYKSDDNVKILENIKRVRQDILDENNIVFILNKVDLITYKDGSIEDVISEVKKLLETVGITDAGILPFSAKKAFLYKLMSENKDLTLYENEIEDMTEVIEKEINGQIYNVKMPRNELVQKFYNESNIGTFESIVLKQLYDERERLLKESLTSYEKNIIGKFLKRNADLLQTLADEISKEIDELKEVESKIEKIEGIKEQIQSIKKSGLKITKLDEKEDALKKYYYKYDSVSNEYASYNGGYDTYYSSSYDALKNGKIAFRNWRNTINIEFIDVYKRYSGYLEYEETTGNKYFEIKQGIEDNLKEVKEICSELEEVSRITNEDIINSKIIKRTKPIMNLEHDNSTIYTEDAYDNSEFVDYDTDERWVEGFWGGDKLKEVYQYDIDHAQKEEIKDAISAKNSCSKSFFEDYYRKDCEFRNEVKEMFDNEMEKVIDFFEKVDNAFKEKIEAIDKTKLDKEKEDLIEMVSIYNKLEGEI